MKLDMVRDIPEPPPIKSYVLTMTPHEFDHLRDCLATVNQDYLNNAQAKVRKAFFDLYQENS